GVKPKNLMTSGKPIIPYWIFGCVMAASRWLGLGSPSFLVVTVRALAGFRLSFQAPSAIQTALTLRQAIWRKPLAQWTLSGVPALFYTDHGRDFTSEHLEQVSADLEISLVFSEPGMPRGRGKIERFFRTLNQMLLCGLPGDTPGGRPPEQEALTV